MSNISNINLADALVELARAREDRIVSAAMAQGDSRSRLDILNDAVDYHDELGALFLAAARLRQKPTTQMDIFLQHNPVLQ